MTGPGGATGSRSLVLAFRVLLLVLAAVAAAMGLWSSRAGDIASTAQEPGYVCPMHPDVTSPVPATCPICGMDLERMRTGADRSSSAAIDPSTYLNYDIMRKRGTGPDTPSPAWVEADGTITAVLYDDEISGLSADGPAFFYEPGSASPERPVRPILASVRPWDRSTSRVTFRVAASEDAGVDALPRPGVVGRVRLTTRGSELPLIPYSAIIEGADGPYVMVASADGRTLSKRPVQVGKAFGGMVFILSGLGARERVLTRSAFFVDAERRLRRETAVEVRR